MGWDIGDLARQPTLKSGLRIGNMGWPTAGARFITAAMLPYHVAAAAASLSLSHFISIALRSVTLPFRGFWDVILACAVILFLVMWAARALPRARPSIYRIVAFDSLGMTVHDGLRTTFRRFDVAWSAMLAYKRSFPHVSFALTGSYGRGKSTILRYLE